MFIRRTTLLKRRVRQLLKFKCLRQLISKLRLHVRIVLAFVMLTSFLSVIVISLIPGEHSFELHLVANQFQFTLNKPSNDEDLRPVLKDIRNVSKISIKGKYERPTPLRGNFEPSLRGNNLKFEMPFESSKVIFSYEERDENTLGRIDFGDLTLQPDTNVILRYLSDKREIEVDYWPPSNSKNTRTAKADIILGSQAIKLQFENCKINSKFYPVYETKFIPLGSEFNSLQLPADGIFSIFLPSTSNKEISTPKWFLVDVEVRNVDFLATETSLDNYDSYSSILEGKAYLKNKELAIKPDQFLIVKTSKASKSSGISKLTHVQISEDKNAFDIRAWGRASKIKIGLDKDYPLEEVSLNKLVELGFTNEQMIAVVSFSSAMVASLLSWLIDNLSQLKNDAE